MTTIDALLRVERFAAEMVPDVIVRIGRPSASKFLAQWTARPEPALIQVGGPGRIDPARNVTAVCALHSVRAAATQRGAGEWSTRWRRADAVASAAMRSQIDAEAELTEPAVARVLAERMDTGAQLTVSSSMPIRDLEWFGGPTAAAHANRGANGIDGVVSTAVGRALSRDDGAEYVLIGDLAFVHDSNALLALAKRDVDVRIIVVDNGGGGIFSFLPQRTMLQHERFEQLFGTPLGSDVLGIAAAHGVPTAEVATSGQLVDQLSRSGPWVCRVVSDRDTNVEVHDRMRRAVVAAVEGDLDAP